MNTVTVAIAAFGITLGLGALAQVSADYHAQLDTSVCAAAPEYAGPDCGNPADFDGDGWLNDE